MDDLIKDLGISKKGKMALNVKPQSSYTKVKSGLLKKKPGNIFYDEVGNIFSVVFDQSGRNYAVIGYQVKNNLIVGCVMEGYVRSSARINEIGSHIKEIMDKNYTSQSEGVWQGKGLKIEYFESADGFSLKFISIN
jgi:hypothetical protein